MNRNGCPPGYIMKIEMDWDLILRYLEGTCSPKDNHKIQEWLASRAVHKKTLDQLQTIWTTPTSRLPKPDVEKALRNVTERVSLHTAPLGEDADNLVHFRARARSIPFIHRFPTLRILRVAALVAVFLTGSYFTFKLLRPSSMKEIAVANGEQRTLILPDETSVTLDSGTHFRYPRSFGDEERTVFLSGEGYFQVTADQTRPFVVHAHRAVITVLGTRFNVRAWRQNRKVIVAVAEGKVSLRSENIPKKEAEVFIEEGQMSRLGEDDIPTIPEPTNINEHLTWLQQEMLFQSVPLQEVLDQLERWYDLEFTLTDTSHADNRITVFIDRKPVDEILDMLSLVNDFEYDREGNRVTFTPK